MISRWAKISLLLVSGRSWVWNANKRPPSFYFSVPVPSHSLSLCTQKGSIADPMVCPKLYLSGEAMILSALNVIYSKRLPKSTQRDRLHSDLCFLASLYPTPGPTTHTLSKWNTHTTQLYGSTKSRTHAHTCKHRRRLMLRSQLGIFYILLCWIWSMA